ncbi:uso1_bovin ame: full=general vesicular transport, partial [Lynx pardinus]
MKQYISLADLLFVLISARLILKDCCLPPHPPPIASDYSFPKIQKLCDRVASSTLLDDRRNAVRALKSLSKKYRLEVGIQAMEHLIHVLQTDRSDSEIIGYALDTLYNIISNDEEEEV